MYQDRNPQGEALETTTSNQSQSSNANSKLDDIKSAVADKLQSAAGTLRERATGQGATADYAGKASTWLNDAADYVRDVDPQQVKTDIQDKVKRNPGRSLLIAGVAGLVLGALLRR